MIQKLLKYYELANKLKLELKEARGKLKYTENPFLTIFLGDQGLTEDGESPRSSSGMIS